MPFFIGGIMKLYEVIYKDGDSAMKKEMFIAHDMSELLSHLNKQRWLNTVTSIQEVEAVVCYG